jgi:hypothetical protein
LFWLEREIGKENFNLVGHPGAVMDEVAAATTPAKEADPLDQRRIRPGPPRNHHGSTARVVPAARREPGRPTDAYGHRLDRDRIQRWN